MPTITREERTRAREAVALAGYDEKLRIFLAFVLGQYVERGVEELGPDKLARLLELKYRAVSDATTQLGGDAQKIREAFLGFQKHLFLQGAHEG